MTTRGELELQLQVPAVEEYLALRVAAGLSAMSAEGAAIGLPASWYSVCVRTDRELVGMGRVVGDGGLFLFVVDIAVAPSWQRHGLGRRIMAALMEQVRARTHSRTMVGLIADGAAFRLYEQFGFKRVAPAAHGMLFRIEKGESA